MLLELIERKSEFFDPVPDKFIFIYNAYNERLFAPLKSSIDFIHYSKVDREMVEDLSSQYKLCILADDMQNSNLSKGQIELFVNLATVFSNNLKFQYIFIGQNVYSSQNWFRTILNNYHAIILFRQRRSVDTVKNFFRQILGGAGKYAISIYHKYVRSRGEFVIISSYPEQEDVLIFANVLKKDFMRDPVTVFKFG